jgi:hypothetical protein
LSAAAMNFCSDPVVKFRSLLLTALRRVPSTASNSRLLRLRLDPLEAESLQIKPIDEGVHEADRVVAADIIVDRPGQKQELRAFEAGYVRHARF